MSEYPEMVKITKKEYDRLIEDSELLEALEVHGVDNWPGYEDAISECGYGDE